MSKKSSTFAPDLKTTSLTIKTINIMTTAMIMSSAMINEIGNYLRETVEDFDVRVELALKTMDRKRCPFGYADSELCDECYDRIEEWCEEHGVEVECIDVEEIIFEMD